MNIEYYLNRLFNEVFSFANTLDTSQWAMISLVTCVAGYMLLKGSDLKGG